MKSTLFSPNIPSRLWNQSFLLYDHEKVIVFNELLGKDAKNLALIINCISICSSIACFGIVANVINLINFTKQGFDNTMNISLFGIAVSDLCTLVTIIWLGVCVNPFLQTDDVALEEIEYLTAGWPNCIFARINCMITVYITIERCLCVTIPLKVKRVITKDKTIAIVISIFISQMLSAIPTYYTAYIGWKFVPEKNMSVLGLCRVGNWEEAEIISFVLQAIMQGGSFVLLIFFTVLLVVTIQRKTKWRMSSTSEIQKQTISIRDKRLVRMIALIAFILIICFTPVMISVTFMIIVPEYNMGRAYDNVFWVSWSINFVFQTVNSSVNIFVYYNMSSRYRMLFLETFEGCRTRLELESKPVSVD